MQVQVLPPGMPSRPGEAVQYALSVRIDLQCRRRTAHSAASQRGSGIALHCVEKKGKDEEMRSKAAE